MVMKHAFDILHPRMDAWISGRKNVYIAPFLVAHKIPREERKCSLQSRPDTAIQNGAFESLREPVRKNVEDAAPKVCAGYPVA